MTRETPPTNAATPARLLLASRSPRRRAMLREAGIGFELAEAPHEPVVVLGADTMCIRGDSLLGQPRDGAEAREMLESFMDGFHRVVTGLAIVAPDGRRQLIADTAEVIWGRVSVDEIDRYIESDNWHGKAGAYNLAERVAQGWPIRVQGDPTTVMGLPMRRLPALLRAWRIDAGAAA